MDGLLTIAKIKELSAAERQAEITRCEILLMDLRIKKVTKQNTKSHEFKKLRTYIAQLISENNKEKITE
jgi:ribosomal protein L29